MDYDYRRHEKNNSVIIITSAYLPIYLSRRFIYFMFHIYILQYISFNEINSILFPSFHSIYSICLKNLSMVNRQFHDLF